MLKEMPKAKGDRLKGKDKAGRWLHDVTPDNGTKLADLGIEKHEYVTGRKTVDSTESPFYRKLRMYVVVDKKGIAPLKRAIEKGKIGIDTASKNCSHRRQKKFREKFFLCDRGQEEATGNATKKRGKGV